MRALERKRVRVTVETLREREMRQSRVCEDGMRWEWSYTRGSCARRYEIDAVVRERKWVSD